MQQVEADINEDGHRHQWFSCSICLTDVTSTNMACETCQFSVCAECCTKVCQCQCQLGQNRNKNEKQGALLVQDTEVIDSDVHGTVLVIILDDPGTLCQQATELLQQLSSARREAESMDDSPSPETNPAPSSAYHQAMGLYQKAFQIRYSVLGPDHITLAALNCLVARALASQRYYTAAVEHYTRAMRIYSSDDNKDNTTTPTFITQQLQKEIAYTLDIMVDAANTAMIQGLEFQANRNQTDAALSQFEYAHSLLASVLQNTPADLMVLEDGALVSQETRQHTLAFVDVCRVLASVHVTLRDYGQALPYLQQAHCVLVPLLGMEDPRTRAMATDKSTVQALALKQNKSNSFVSDDDNDDDDDDDNAEMMHWFERDDYFSNDNDNDTLEIGNDNIVQVAPEDTCSVAQAEKTTYLGVSVSWIKRGFWEELQSAYLTPNDTMLAVLEKVIRPKCISETVASYRASLPSKHTGPASVLISYADESSIADVINTLDDYCRVHGHKDQGVYVWMRCLCEPTDEENISDTSNHQKSKALRQRIASIGHVLAIMAPWTHPLVWKQAVSLLEIYAAAHQIPGCKLTLVLPPAQTAAVSDALVGDLHAPIATLYKALENLQVEIADPRSKIKPHQVTQGLQSIFRPWIRNVLKAQVQQHCIISEDTIDSATTASMGADENDPPTKRPSVTLADGREVALEVFQLQLCNKMGLLFWDYGEYKAALELLEDALGMTERMYGEEHESTATVYQNIANVCFDMGRYEVARHTYHKVLSLMEALLPEHHPRIAGICTKLGHIYNSMDDFDEAMEFHQRALTIHAKNHRSTNNLASADSYNNIGNTLYCKGNNDAALMEFTKALGIQQSILGAEKHPTLALTHAHIGMVMKAEGNLEGAVKEYQTAAMIQEAALGTDHVQTALTYENLASVFRSQDNLDAALEFCGKSKESYEKALGAYHPTTATAWQTLGTIQNCMDMVEDALHSYHKSLEIRESVLVDVQPTAETLQSIGTLLFEIGDLDEALVSLRKAFDMLEPILGIEHPTTQGLADTINAVLEA
jgi:tetratricopeptide (TPR) repeat protein